MAGQSPFRPPDGAPVGKNILHAGLLDGQLMEKEVGQLSDSQVVGKIQGYRNPGLDGRPKTVRQIGAIDVLIEVDPDPDGDLAVGPIALDLRQLHPGQAGQEEEKATVGEPPMLDDLTQSPHRKDVGIALEIGGL